MFRHSQSLNFSSKDKSPPGNSVRPFLAAKQPALGRFARETQEGRLLETLNLLFDALPRQTSASSPIHFVAGPSA